MDGLWIVIWWVAIPVFAMMFANAYIEKDEPVPRRKRPKLSGNDLLTWTQLYQAHMRVAQSQLFTSEQDVHDWTWERWHELTGKPQWEGKKSKEGK